MLDQGVELRPVIHVDAVRHFVGDRRAPDPVGSQDQPPAITDRAGMGAASPAGDRIANADPVDADFRARRIFTGFSIKQQARLPFQPSDHSGFQGFGRPADQQPILFDLHRPRPIFLPVDPVGLPR